VRWATIAGGMFVTFLEAWNHHSYFPLLRHVSFVETELKESSKGSCKLSGSISEYYSKDPIWTRGLVDIKLLKLFSDFLFFARKPLWNTWRQF